MLSSYFHTIPGIVNHETYELQPSLDQGKHPTVLFYAAYVFEARMDGDTLEFPLLPGETTIGTLDRFSETAQGYLQQLKSIYAFNHYALLTTLSSGLTVGLGKGDGLSEDLQIFGAKKHLFSLQTGYKSGPENGLISLHIEAQLDTATTEKSTLPSEDRIYLFRTQCTVKSGHPLVIGRPLKSKDQNQTAIFVVFTPFFRQITGIDTYEEIISDFRKIFQISASHSDERKRFLLDRINTYFEKRFKNAETIAFKDVFPIPPPPPPPPDRADIPIFVPHDQHPEPVGGYATIQKNIIYPEAARKAGIEGRVLVWAKIDELGKVRTMRIMTSLGPDGCDEAAMEAIRRTKWKPAMKDDQPITVWIAVPVEFRLK